MIHLATITYINYFYNLLSRNARLNINTMYDMSPMFASFILILVWMITDSEILGWSSVAFLIISALRFFTKEIS